MGVGLRVLPVILLVACDAGEKPRGVQATAPRTCVEAAGWSPISTKNAPPASERLLHAVVDDKLLVVGPAGGRLLDPCTDTWTTIDTTNMPPHLVGYGADLPVTRAGPYAVWFHPGTQDSTSPEDATIGAAVFDSRSRTWSTVPRTGALATPREQPITRWTGNELLVFGGTAHVKQPNGGTKPTALTDGFAIDLASGRTRMLAANEVTAAPPADDVHPSGPPLPDRTFFQVRARVGAYDVVWGTVTEQGTGRWTGCDGPRRPGDPGCDPYEVTVLVPKAQGWRMQSSH